MIAKLISYGPYVPFGLFPFTVDAWLLTDAWERMTFGGIKIPGTLHVNMDSWDWVVDAVC